jgi:hypothetical protein
MKIVTYGIGGYDPTKPNNNIVEERIIDDPPQAPLDSSGALATLLAVTGTLTVEDAANAVGLNPADLVAEAQAWAVGNI